MDTTKIISEDLVNHPPHYTDGNIECIDAIESAVAGMSDGFSAYCTAAAIKYLWRWKLKGTPKQDLEKARWYIDKLLTRIW